MNKSITDELWSLQSNGQYRKAILNTKHYKVQRRDTNPLDENCFLHFWKHFPQYSFIPVLKINKQKAISPLWLGKKEGGKRKSFSCPLPAGLQLGLKPLLLCFLYVYHLWPPFIQRENGKQFICVRVHLIFSSI